MQAVPLDGVQMRSAGNQDNRFAGQMQFRSDCASHAACAIDDEPHCFPFQHFAPAAPTGAT